MFARSCLCVFMSVVFVSIDIAEEPSNYVHAILAKFVAFLALEGFFSLELYHVSRLLHMFLQQVIWKK